MTNTNVNRPGEYTYGPSIPTEGFYTFETMIGEIAINAVNLREKLLNGYIDITVPLDQISSFVVPTASIVVRSEDIKDVANNTWTKRVYLNTLDSTVNGAFQYNLKFNTRRTPRGFEFSPKVELFTSDAVLVK